MTRPICYRPPRNSLQFTSHHVLRSFSLSTNLSVTPPPPRQAVELNINKVFSETAISGNDYLKNLIHLPFFLQNSALRKVNLAQKVAASRERCAITTGADGGAMVPMVGWWWWGDGADG